MPYRNLTSSTKVCDREIKGTLYYCNINLKYIVNVNVHFLYHSNVTGGLLVLSISPIALIVVTHHRIHKYTDIQVHYASFSYFFV